MELQNKNNFSHTEATSGVGTFFAGIYKWMCGGILITALFSYLTLNTSLGSYVFSSGIFWGIVIIEFILLLGIQFMIRKMEPSTATALFFLYAALNGITLSGIFLIYTGASILNIFLISAAIFGGLSLYGYTTKKDLSGWGTFLFIGVLAILITSVVNIFLGNTFFQMLISGAAVLIFSALVAYDANIYKQIYENVKTGGEKEVRRYMALGALQMYINFVMIFVHLLQLFGDRN